MSRSTGESRFSWARAWAVCLKDFIELRKNRALLVSMLALPVMIVLVPIGMVASYVYRSDDGNLKVMAHFFDPNIDSANAVRFLVDKVLLDWFSIYLVMPVFVPVLISSHAVAGEKEKRTLEPLLSTPLTGTEMLIGKSLASLLPSVVICFIAFALLCLGIDIVTYDAFRQILMPNTMWMFGVFVISPLFAFFGNGVAVLISARVGDARLAQQLSGLTVLPLVGLAAGQFAGFLSAGRGYFAGLTFFVLILDWAIIIIARHLFDRDRLISKWG
jgi:ABC-2 type transport system permease protein